MSILPLVRLWARTLVRLFPPGWSRSQRQDLARLLTDDARSAVRRGMVPLLMYVTGNSLICGRDALLEWVAAVPTTTMGSETMWNVRMEAKHALRGLLRRPGYSVPALLTLALGIGITTAMFSVLYGVVLRPLPYPEPEELVQVYGTHAETGVTAATFSLPDARDWQERSTALEHLAAYSTLPSDLIYVADGTAREVQTAYVSHSFFDVLGSTPATGRFFRRVDGDDDPMVAVVSERFFEQQLGGDPGVIGSTLELTGRSYRLLGVAPRKLTFPEPEIDLWVPLATIPPSSIPLHIRQVRFLNAVGRLSENATVESATADLTSVALGLREEYPDANENVSGASLMPLMDRIVGPVRGALALLMGAAIMVLSIVCVNVANLALARESKRETELAVRAALGASAARRMRLVVTESLVLSAAGGLLGLAFAVGATDFLGSSAAEILPRAGSIGVQWPVAAFSVVAALLTGLAFAVLPGLRAARADLASRIRSDSGRSTRMGRTRALMVGGQAALSLGLLVGAVMMINSLSNLSGVDPGFESRDLIVADITFPASTYPERPDYLAQYWATLEAFRRIPGVESASAVRRFPFRGTGESSYWSVTGTEEEDAEHSASLLQLAPDYFRTMGIPIVEGSDLPRDADPEATIPVVLSRRVATAAFPGESAVGRSFSVDGYGMVVRGVVEDVHQAGVTEAPSPLVYIPQEASPRRGGWFVLATDGTTGVLQRVRETLQALDPGQPITELAFAEDLFGEQLARPALLTSLITFFAVAALLLSAIGVYGVIAFVVASRRREMGIRLALGADAGQVRSMIMRDGMIPIVAGALVGLVGSLLAARIMESLVFGMSVRDPGTYVMATLAIGITGLLACWLPARSASGIDPVEALEAE